MLLAWHNFTNLPLCQALETQQDYLAAMEENHIYFRVHPVQHL